MACVIASGTPLEAMCECGHYAGSHDWPAMTCRACELNDIRRRVDELREALDNVTRSL